MTAGPGSVAEARATGLIERLLPAWLAQVSDPAGGVFDALDAQGKPDPNAPKTVLAQARTLFSLAHLALLSPQPEALTEAAARQLTVLEWFRKAPGLYRRATRADGGPTGLAADEAARCYDQSFVLLALTTWNRLSPSDQVAAEIEACLHALDTRLTDPATGLLLEDDTITDPAAATAPLRSQNPHMHFYEAFLQAHEMDRDPRWLKRAADLRALALRHFLDEDSGSIREWLAPDLGPAPGTHALRREPGHQFEWAWLLNREADFGGDAGLRVIAARLLAFADAHGVARSGPLAGAALDAVSPDGAVLEGSSLLWPQTEAIKALAIRHAAGDPAAGARAAGLLILMADRWFPEGGFWINQLDPAGSVIWPEALTRLFYHLVLALTEGARTGLWPGMLRG